MDGLDGNAAAGMLQEIFGAELTAVAATCATCEAVAPIGEGGLYAGGPGTVLRCRSCDGVLIVITQVRGIYCLDLMGIQSMSALTG